MNEYESIVLQELQKVNSKLDYLIQSTKQLSELPESNTLTAEQAARYLHLSVSRIYCLVNEGKLRPMQRKKNSRLLFSPVQLDQYLTETRLIE